MIYLYFRYYGNHGAGVVFEPPKSFVVLLPRLMSSFMMHLNIMGNIEQGISIMKYTVNHPYLFLRMHDDHEQGKHSQMDDTEHRKSHIEER